MDTNNKIVFSELSYKVTGASFRAFNELGWGLPEKDYQRALAVELDKLGIKFEREIYIPIKYQTNNIGRYFADFIIENKILLELKVVSKLGYAHTKQILSYLKNFEIRLGIILYFTREGVKYRRVLNSDIKDV